MMSDQDIIDLAATADFTYRGSLPTTGCCNRCDTQPDTGCLHQLDISGHPERSLLEIGPACLKGQPKTGNNWQVVLSQAWRSETDAVRKGKLRHNLDELLKVK